MNRFAVVGLVALVAPCSAVAAPVRSRRWRPRSPPSTATRSRSTTWRCATSACRPSQTGDFLQPGRTVDLVVVAVNQSPDVADRLVSITSDIGTVTIDGDARLPAGGMLFIGTPEGQKVAPGPLESNNAVKATVDFGQAHQQRPDLQLHLQFREGRAGQRAGADFGRVGATAGLSRSDRPVTPGLSHRPDTVMTWPHARSQYRCSECRHVTAKWVGRCLECGTWGTVDEVPVLSAVGGSGRRAGLASASGFASRSDQLHRAERQPAPLDGHRRTRPGARAAAWCPVR